MNLSLAYKYMQLSNNEHLKAAAVLVILEATGEFIKMIPLATEVWECVHACGRGSQEEEQAEA